jgi:predicted glycosyltransferase
MKRSRLRVMIYSQDGFGLGHLRRNLNIAVQIRRQASASVLVLADSPAAPFFPLPPYVDFIKVPTLVKVNTGIWQSDRLELPPQEIVDIRSAMIREIALSYRPHVLLVDHMPYGVSQELQPALVALKRHNRRTRVVLGLRDILGAPQDICPQWERDDAFNAIASYYDRVLVYGSPEVFPSLEEYQFPSAVVAKSSYCGYVTREHVRPSPPARDEGRDPMVLVTGGGGADASFFMDKFLDGMRLLLGKARFRVVLTTGPFLHQDQYELLRRKAAGAPVRVIRDARDSVHLMQRADVVVCMAGYNTVSEILRFQKPAIIIPRPGPSAEQTMRTRIMSARGLFGTIHPRDLTGESLAEMLAVKLAERAGPDPAALPPLDGASRAASHIIGEGLGVAREVAA